MVAYANMPFCVYIGDEKVAQLEYIDCNFPITTIRVITSWARQADVQLLLRQLGCKYRLEHGNREDVVITLKIKLETDSGRYQVLSDLARVIRNYSIDYDRCLRMQLAWV